MASRTSALLALLACAGLIAIPTRAAAQQPAVSLGLGGADSGFVKLVLLFASVSLAPALLAVVTSFARIAVVLFFLRAGLGSQEIPPNYVIIGLAILLTVASMLPTLTPIHEQAVAPLLRDEIGLEEAGEAAARPLREFMAGQVRTADLELMLSLTETPPTDDAAGAPLGVLASSFAISELRLAFLIGFIVYLPFVIIDLVVGSTLASIGMLSLPAPVLSLPFKIMLFVMVDGWALLTRSLLSTID